MEKCKTLCETFAKSLKIKAQCFKVPLISAWITGLLTYMFTFTNKLMNFDDIEYLFDMGASLSSGRWGLSFLKYIIPNYSMPWFNGIITLAIMSVSVCVIIDTFKIKNRYLQCLLAGIIVSFPAMIDTFVFMFTSIAYAIAFLITAFALWFFEKGKVKDYCISAVLMVLSLSIYQAYITIASSLLIILIIKLLLDDKSCVKAVVIKSLKALMLLALSMAVYFAFTKVALKVFGVTYNNYANEHIDAVINRFYGVNFAYVNFIKIFTGEGFGIVNGTLSQIIHIALFTGAVICSLVILIKRKQILKAAAFIVLLILLPVSINAFYMFSVMAVRMMFSFIAVYLLVAVVLEKIVSEQWNIKIKNILKDLVYIGFAVIVLSNIFLANKLYLQMKITYENSFSFYTSVVTQIKMNPEFEENTKIALIGETDELIYMTEEFGKSKIQGINNELINIYSRDKFIKYYIGFDADFATDSEKEQIKATDEYKNMADYPYAGSVKRIGDYMVVKFGDNFVRQ